MLPSLPNSAPRGAAGYPSRLEILSRPPACLWYRGSGLEALAAPGSGVGVVAIVGSRAASEGGRQRARALAAGLGQRGLAVVSGGAFGIDAAAHEGALAVGARTFAVLGCGVDVVYPDRHEALFHAIAGSGALLSEYPPGTQARRGQFPARNRIIAALADVVIVVEAAWRSGALSTATAARRLGRPLMATAGSPGTDRLLGAHPGRVHEESGVESVLQLLAGSPRAARQLALPSASSFSSVVAALAQAPDSAEGLAARLGLPLAKVMSELGLAEIDGWLRRTPDGAYEVTRAH